MLPKFLVLCQHSTTGRLEICVASPGPEWIVVQSGTLRALLALKNAMERDDDASRHFVECVFAFGDISGVWHHDA